MNLKMPCIMENNHKGILPQHFCGFACDKKNIEISALKLSEDGKGIVLRAYETDGVSTRAKLYGALLPADLEAEFGAYSVNTYYYTFETAKWKEVLLTEYDF